MNYKRMKNNSLSFIILYFLAISMSISLIFFVSITQLVIFLAISLNLYILNIILIVDAFKIGNNTAGILSIIGITILPLLSLIGAFIFHSHIKNFIRSRYVSKNNSINDYYNDINDMRNHIPSPKSSSNTKYTPKSNSSTSEDIWDINTKFEWD